MLANKLCLNQSKTEFFVFGKPHHVKHIPQISLKIGEEHIKPSHHVQNQDFRMHLSNIVKACRFQIQKAWRQFRGTLTKKPSNA